MFYSGGGFNLVESGVRGIGRVLLADIFHPRLPAVDAGNGGDSLRGGALDESGRAGWTLFSTYANYRHLLGHSVKSMLRMWGRWSLCLAGLLLGIQSRTPAVSAQVQLPPADEIPEEILRTEIIFEARSPIDGQPLTATEYAELQAALRAPSDTPLIRSDIRYLVFLLQARRAVKPIVPFLP